MSEKNRFNRSYQNIDYWKKYIPFLTDSLKPTKNSPKETWWNWKNSQIHIDEYNPDDYSASIIILHGVGGYGRLFIPFAVLLKKAGFRVIVPDLPGYGITGFTKRNFSFNDWVNCASDLLKHEIKTTEKPVFLFGMSAGGYLAYLTAARTGLASGIFATTLGDPRQQSTIDDYALNKFTARILLPFFNPVVPVFGKLKLPIKWFTKMHRIAKNPNLVKIINKDPYGGGNKTPLSFMYSIFDVIPDIEPENFDLCPVIFMHPEKDTWTRLETSKEFFDKIKGEKELIILKNCGHLPIEEPGISLIEKTVSRLINGVNNSHV